MSISYLYEKYARKMTICLLGSNSCNCCTMHSKQAMITLKGDITPSSGTYSYLPHPALPYAYPAPTPTPAPALPLRPGHDWDMAVAGRTSEKLILAMFARLFPRFYPPFSQVLPVLAYYAGDGAVVSVQASRVQQLFSASSDAFQREFRRRSDVSGYDHTAKSNFSGFLPGWFPVHAWFSSGLSRLFWKWIEYALTASAASWGADICFARNGKCYE